MTLERHNRSFKNIQADVKLPVLKEKEAEGVCVRYAYVCRIIRSRV